MILPPDPVPVEGEIFDFFASRNFERSRRFAPGAYDPQHLKKFLIKIGNPQFAYETIHVAGTVGKGSATTYLSRALTAMGFKTGAYLSPHFVSLTERFTIAGAAMPANALAALWRELKAYREFETLSFFDAMTALGFLYFARERCEWAVIETGLGGRMDSTNNLKARLAVITLIDFDHQNILGSTLDAIAREKAGIIHPGQTVYTVAQQAPAAHVLQTTCAEKAATLRLIETPAESYLLRNREFALAIIDDAFKLTEAQRQAVQSDLQKPIFGRLSLLRNTPRVFFDGGHNEASMRALCEFITAQAEPACNIFLNTMTERDLIRMTDILRAVTGKNLNLYFLPIADPAYYSEAPAAARLGTLNDAAIRETIGVADQLNLFTGSMGIYKELKIRFAL